MILQTGGAVPLPESLFHPGPTIRVQELFGPRFELGFRAVSELGTSWGVVFAVGLALWTWGRRDTYALVGMSAVSAVASVVMNLLFDVPRPSHPAIVEYEQVDLGSFPSGHVFLATVLWGVLYARGRVSAWTLALVIAGVSASRLFLGVHYLVDVIGGAVFALAVVAAYHPLWTRLRAGCGSGASACTWPAGCWWCSPPPPGRWPARTGPIRSSGTRPDWRPAGPSRCCWSTGSCGTSPPPALSARRSGSSSASPGSPRSSWPITPGRTTRIYAAPCSWPWALSGRCSSFRWSCGRRRTGSPGPAGDRGTVTDCRGGGCHVGRGAWFRTTRFRAGLEDVIVACR